MGGVAKILMKNGKEYKLRRYLGHFSSQDINTVKEAIANPETMEMITCGYYRLLSREVAGIMIVNFSWYEPWKYFY